MNSKSSATFSEFLQFTLKEYQFDLKKIKKKHTHNLRVMEKNRKEWKLGERDNWEKEYNNIVEEYDNTDQNILLNSQNGKYEDINYKNLTRKKRMMVYWKNAKNPKKKKK